MLMPFDPQTLKTSGKRATFEQFDKRLKGPFSSAHGQYDATRKEYVCAFLVFRARFVVIVLMRSHTHTHTHTTPDQLRVRHRGWSYVHHLCHSR
jgi:hypothetical protein